MNDGQWAAFVAFRNSYKELCEQWNTAFAQELQPLQKRASLKDTPPYPVETPVVYNTAYDCFTKADEITLIVIGDNPGKEEQLFKNRRYLVGQSGRIAEGFFRRHGEFNTDFRKNVIIINKTPVHTAKTAHLKFLSKNGSEKIKNLIQESQIATAQMTARLHQQLVKNSTGESVPQLWLVGYAELKKNGIFASYRDELKKVYEAPDGRRDAAWEKVFVYQHFSMNRFLVDLKNYQAKNMGTDLPKALEELGRLHRDEIFGEAQTCARRGIKMIALLALCFFFSRAIYAEPSAKEGFAPFLDLGILGMSVNAEYLSQSYDYDYMDNAFFRQFPLFIFPAPFLTGGCRHSASQGIFSLRNAAEATLSFAGAGASVTSSLSITPLLSFFAKAHIETAWNYGTWFEFLGVYNPAEAEYDDVSSFSEYSYGVAFGAKGLIPLPKGNMIQLTYNTDYIAFSGAEDGEPWKCGVAYNCVNGWRYEGGVMVAHAFEGGALKFVGLSGSVSGRYSEDDYDSIYLPFNPAFKTYSLSLASQFSVTEKQSLMIMAKASRDRKFEKGTDEYDAEETLMQTYTGARWRFDGIMVVWTIHLVP